MFIHEINVVGLALHVWPLNILLVPATFQV